MSTEADIYTAYYMSQAGSGFGNIYSTPAFQRGMGIGNKKTHKLHEKSYFNNHKLFTGSFLSGLFRSVVPIMKKGSAALGQELLKSGLGAAEDIWKTGDLEYTKEKRGKEIINNISNRISDHMFGSGYTPYSLNRLPQLRTAIKRRRTAKATKRKTKKKVTKRKVTKKKAAKIRIFLL